MIRSPLLYVGILVAACFACAQPPGTATSANASTGTSLAAGPATMIGSGTGTASCTASQFANAAQMFGPPAGYIASGLGAPPSNSLSNVTSLPILNDLTQAFTVLANTTNAASAKKLQTNLCMTTILIDTTACAAPSPYSCGSWGFRIPAAGANPSQRYIVLSQSLWNNSGEVQNYSIYETALLSQTLKELHIPWQTMGASTAPPSPTFCASAPGNCAMSGGTSVDKPTTTVLAAIAHEYGHILWYDLLKSSDTSYNANYDPNILCRGAKPKIRAGGFFDNNWKPVAQPPVWADFAQTTTDMHHGTKKQTHELIAAIHEQSGPDWAFAAAHLDALYSAELDGSGNVANRNGVWPSLLGSLSPQEDFVETFKLYVLTRLYTTPVTTMPLSIYASTSGTAKNDDIFSDIANGLKRELSKKMDCIDSQLPNNPT